MGGGQSFPSEPEVVDDYDEEAEIETEQIVEALRKAGRMTKMTTSSQLNELNQKKNLFVAMSEDQRFIALSGLKGDALRIGCQDSYLRRLCETDSFRHLRKVIRIIRYLVTLNEGDFKLQDGMEYDCWSKKWNRNHGRTGREYHLNCAGTWQQQRTDPISEEHVMAYILQDYFVNDYDKIEVQAWGLRTNSQLPAAAMTLVNRNHGIYEVDLNTAAQLMTDDEVDALTSPRSD